MFCANVGSQEEKQLFGVKTTSHGLQKVKEKQVV
jgi:hypothetical protein